ncbi:hypothetical protein C8J56DRAFT_910528 [Mycena floridula]|nr:hypothetical protein C8J56DRAFT_910528 [Mycena floridula]
MSFRPLRNLLNPRFEGYRLDPIAQDDFVARFDLQYQVSQSTSSTRSPLAFQEIQSRITHNHLAVASAGRALYVDVNWNVICIDIAALVPSFRIAYELPKPIQTAGIDDVHREYPSAAFLSPSEVFVSDGCGNLYTFAAPETGSFELLSAQQLPVSLPFRIHSAHPVSSTDAVVILSSRNYSPSEAGKKKVIDFDIWAAKFARPLSENSSMNIVWRRRGPDVPIYTAYDSSRSSYILLGGGMYSQIDAPEPPSYEPRPSEYAPIPQKEEKLDSGRPPPYSWTQTTDSVTIAFALLSTTSKSDIHVKFTAHSLDLQISGDEASNISYSAKELWARILPSTSYWTWDREGGHSVGLLTLYLDKQHEGTKWMHVFASSGTSATSESKPEDIDVPETLDPSELWHIRESLEKYTQALRDGEDASGLGLGRGVPSMAEGEMDESVDNSIGRSAFVTWVSEDGSQPAWASNDRGHNFIQLLSTPLPGENGTISVISKNDVDGTLFQLTSSVEEASQWNHTSTYSALAFVLASKQDTRFTYHIPSKAVFAFESGVRDRGGNVYIYRASPVKEKWAKQAILKVGDGSGGSLLGVGLINDGKDNAILCLLERELVLIKNIAP